MDPGPSADSRADVNRIEPKGHLVVDREFLACPYLSFSKHVDKKFIDMAHENTVGLMRVTEQTGISKGDRGAAMMLIQILFDRMVLPHEDVSKNNGLIDREAL